MVASQTWYKLVRLCGSEVPKLGSRPTRAAQAIVPQMGEALWGLPFCPSHTRAKPFLEADWQALSIFKASDTLFAAVPLPHSQGTVAVLPACQGNECCFPLCLVTTL